MTQSDQMLEFIDGTLSGSREQELFEQLAAQPELRTELRHYVQIGDAVRADREAFAPPADVERRLLGGLGLIPLGAAAGGAAGTAAGGFAAASLLKGGILPLLSGFLLGALLVGGGVWYALDGGEGSGDGSPVVAATGRENADVTWIEPASARAPEHFGVGATFALTNRQDGSVNSSRPLASYSVPSGPVPTRVISVDGRSSDLKGSENAENTTDKLNSQGATDHQTVPTLEVAPPVDVQLRSLSPVEFRQLQNTVNESIDAVPTPTPLVVNDPLAETEPKVHLEYRKLLVNSPIVDNHAREVPVGGVDGIFAESFVAGGYFSPKEKLQIGVEVGRERYAQSFFYNRNDSLVIEQRPLLGWGGVAARLQTDLLPIPVQFGATLGFSEHGGPVARGLVGVDFLDLFPGVSSKGRFSLPIGFEMSSLVYTVNDQYFVSGNWGFSLGGRIGF